MGHVSGLWWILGHIGKGRGQNTSSYGFTGKKKKKKVDNKVRGRPNTLKKLNFEETKRKEWFNDVKKKLLESDFHQSFSKR